MIVLVVRKLTEPVEIGGYELPAGAARHALHPPDPPRPGDLPRTGRASCPERFLENPPGTYTWIPFGGGVRRCLGAAFAQFEMAVVLRELVRRHEIRPGAPSPSAPSAARSPRRRATTPR